MDWKRSDLYRTCFGEGQLILICWRCSWITLARIVTCYSFEVKLWKRQIYEYLLVWRELFRYFRLAYSDTFQISCTLSKYLFNLAKLRIDAFELWCWRRLLRVPWTARRSNPKGKSVLGVHWKDWCWSWNSNTLATWWEELTHLKRPWCWEWFGAGGEGDNRGWDGWMASLTLWMWVWVNSGSWWWTGRPGVLQSMGSQRVKHNWATELKWNFWESSLTYWSL